MAQFVTILRTQSLWYVMWAHTVSNFTLLEKHPNNDMVRLHSTNSDSWDKLIAWREASNVKTQMQTPSTLGK